MVRLPTTCICVLAFGSLILLTAMSKPVTQPESVTIFITGNELGALKPCGCAGGQLGGLDRRSAILKTAAPEKRLIIDTGSLVKSDSPQDLIKFNIVVQSLSLLNYDLVNLTESDIGHAQNLGLLESLDSLFNVITSHKSEDVNLPVMFTTQFPFKDKVITVNIATFNPQAESLKKLREIFPDDPCRESVNILIMNYFDSEAIEAIEKTAIVDCMITSTDSDEPSLIPTPNKTMLVLTPGRLGKYIGKLTIKPALEYSWFPVTGDLTQEESLTEIYSLYQLLVKEENLMEKWPRSQLPDNLEYIGSKACELCHEYEYKKWQSKAHAHAYATLEKVGSQYDPECVVCHVVGMDYQSGFVSEEKTPDLKNVGCENCHGPGSEHLKTPETAKTARTKLVCLDCHTSEHSNYPGNEKSYFEKIIHWREPNAPADVK
jgi:hypothetical protein